MSSSKAFILSFTFLIFLIIPLSYAEQIELCESVDIGAFGSYGCKTELVGVEKDILVEGDIKDSDGLWDGVYYNVKDTLKDAKLVVYVKEGSGEININQNNNVLLNTIPITDRIELDVPEDSLNILIYPAKASDYFIVSSVRLLSSINCGDEVCDSFEDYELCPEDCKKLIECGQDEDCSTYNRILRKKQCSERNVVFQIKKTIYSCKAGKCESSISEVQEIIQRCEELDTICYNGECGCPKTMQPCKAYAMCLKENTKKSGQSYYCEFECESGFGKNGICFDPLTIAFSTIKQKLYIGEETDVTISFDNALDNNIKANMLIKIGNGMSVTSAVSSDICSNNLCKIYREIPSKSSKSLSLSLECNDAVLVPIETKVTYSIGDKVGTTSKNIMIECMNKEAKEEAQSSKMGAIKNRTFLYAGIALLIIIILIVIILVKRKSR